MRFAIDLATEPMEARSVAELPRESSWQFEPKWDGFRCLAYRQGGDVELMSKSGKSLARYFPELVAALRDAAPAPFVLDGELVIPHGETLSFDALQARVHPAESRIRRLSAETPALFVAFDCLASGDDVLLDTDLQARRAALEAWFAAPGTPASFRLTPMTRKRVEAERWLASAGGALDGVVAKRLDGRYRAGERDMLKVKRLRTADCVVGGFRYASGSRLVGSLLLGLHDASGKLHHVGFTSAISDAERPALTEKLEALVEKPGFTGDTPGGPSRWANARSAEWQPLRTELVVEVRYDQVTGRRFRHGTMLMRWRPDKAPRQCVPADGYGRGAADRSSHW